VILPQPDPTTPIWTVRKGENHATDHMQVLAKFQGRRIMWGFVVVE
jgi:hypothetical protein